MSRQSWHRAGSVRVVRVATVLLMAALLTLLAAPCLVHAGGNVSVTRQFSPTANAAVTVDAGDLNGFETTPANAYADDSTFAEDVNSGANANSDPTGTGTDKHNFYTYGLLNKIPAGSAILGITVRADITVTTTKDSPFTAIRLSYDGGTSWTAVKQTTLTATTETTYTYGGASDLWGYAWTTSELSDANFRLQVINGELKDNLSNYDFSLDWIPVSITYTAPWDSYEDSGRTTIRDLFTIDYTWAYMRGTGFPNGDYDVAYYDAGINGGQKVYPELNITVSGGTLDSTLQLNRDWGGSPPTAGVGWHVLVQPATATDFPLDYDTVATGTGPEDYDLLANDSFETTTEAIPEFSTVLAAIAVSGLCFGIYYWMRRRVRRVAL
ncbi:hypothetical protein ACFLWY_02430 [Chloroflexota bacterium]